MWTILTLICYSYNFMVHPCTQRDFYLQRT